MFIYFAILKEFKHYVKYFLAKTKEIKNPNNVVEVFKERKKVIRFIRRFLVKTMSSLKKFITTTPHDKTHFPATNQAHYCW